MKDTVFLKQQMRLQKEILFWRNLLPLDGWDITYNYFDEPWPNQDGAVGRTTADWSYMHATIDWYVPGLVRVDDEELEKMVIHEFVHCLLCSMTKYALGAYGSSHVMDMAQMEQQTTLATLAIRRAFQGGKRSAAPDGPKQEPEPGDVGSDGESSSPVLGDARVGGEDVPPRTIQVSDPDQSRGSTNVVFKVVDP